MTAIIVTKIIWEYRLLYLEMWLCIFFILNLSGTLTSLSPFLLIRRLTTVRALLFESGSHCSVSWAVRGLTALPALPP